MARGMFPSPMGRVAVETEDGAVVALSFLDDGEPDVVADRPDDPLLAACERQFGEYFAGKRKAFEIPVRLKGTDFRRAVWNVLREIPYGGVVSYGAVAAAAGMPSAARAVGGAVGANPVAVIVPCHRVIGADGSMTGFGGGIWRKEFLLALERADL